MEDEGVARPGIVHQALHLPGHVGFRGPCILAGLIICEQDDVLQSSRTFFSPTCCT